MPLTGRGFRVARSIDFVAVASGVENQTLTGLVAEAVTVPSLAYAT